MRHTRISQTLRDFVRDARGPFFRVPTCDQGAEVMHKTATAILIVLFVTVLGIPAAQGDRPGSYDNIYKGQRSSRGTGQRPSHGASNAAQLATSQFAASQCRPIAAPQFHRPVYWWSVGLFLLAGTQLWLLLSRRELCQLGSHRHLLQSLLKLHRVLSAAQLHAC